MATLKYKDLSDPEKIRYVTLMTDLRQTVGKSVAHEDKVATATGPYGKLYRLVMTMGYDKAAEGKHQALDSFLDQLCRKYGCTGVDRDSFP